MQLIPIGHSFSELLTGDEWSDAASVLKKLLKLGGKVKSIDIATAYTDVNAVKSLIKLANADGDGRGTKLRIYLDYQSAVKLRNELEFEGNSDVKKIFADALFEIYSGGTCKIKVRPVKQGTLFHAKAMLIETTTHRSAYVGSANFTTRGFSTNAELGVVVTSKEPQGSKSQKNIFLNELDKYFEDLHESIKSDKALDDFWTYPDRASKTSYSDWRSFSLAGSLWFESKEHNTFRFPLDLKETDRRIDPELNGKDLGIPAFLDNAIDVLEILAPAALREVDKKNKKKIDHEDSQHWKKYCIQTCLGLWAPYEWKDEIEKALDNKKTSKHAVFNTIFDDLQETVKQRELTRKIIVKYQEIWSKLSAGGITKNTDLATLDKRVSKWVERVANKVKSKEYKTRFYRGVDFVSTPDLWGASPYDAEKFQTSFLENLRYELDKRRKTSQIAQAIHNTGWDNAASRGDEEHYANLTKSVFDSRETGWK